ncbi:MAG: EF-Tu/IF-2/RF-3 family GTPase [Candidatus Eisenbacteria bacterium]
MEPQSEMVRHQADRYHIPRIVFINKMDRLGANFEAALDDLREKLGAKPTVTHFPVGASSDFRGVVDVIRGEMLVWGEADQGLSFQREPVPAEEEERYQTYRAELLEAAAAEDDDLLTAFLDGNELSPEEIIRGLRLGTIRRSLIPVLSGASLRNRGIQPLLDAIVDYLPAPDEVPAPIVVDQKTGERFAREAHVKSPFLGLVFKTHTERDRGRASYVRIYSGKIEPGSTVLVTRLGQSERVARLFRVHADKRKQLDEAHAGDIVVFTGLKLAATGDTLCVGDPVLLEGIQFPDPVVSASLEASSSAEEEKVQNALAKLAGDDPTFRVKIDENTGQTVISGMGELHLEVLEQRLVREFGLKVRLGRPQVTYRETISVAIDSEGVFDRFTGGTDNYARVALRLEPEARGGGFVFENALPPERIPPALVQTIASSIRDATESGIQFGYPVVDIRVTLVGGDWNEQRSTELAFRNAAISAFRDGCRQAKPLLLEPIMSLEIVTPRDFVGGVMNGLAQRQGRVLGTEMRELVQILDAEAPLAQMFGYATDLRSASQGRATYSMLFSHFDVAARGGAPGGA